ncbi:NAD(P)H-hydrate dehydratase [Shivajiella indica]|uniref:Bifunctional NAD(P)H-hydrate repair enzyme n=1 Tax=Shivajiella indica TaxID=872115 RepID=A0ABW5BE28_9BACT
MLSIIPGNKVSELDSSYILDQGITSWDLMERAAISFCSWFKGRKNFEDKPVFIFSGPGNNGGDGVAIARILAAFHLEVNLIVFDAIDHCSKDFQINYKKLPSTVKVFKIEDFDFRIDVHAVIIDGIFGVGINRPLEGKFKEAIDRLNTFDCQKIAIDIPSGIPADGLLQGSAFRADYTVTFQFPKLSLLFPEHGEYTGEIFVADIGIQDNFLEKFASGKYFIQQRDMRPLHKTFHKFSHKGDFGKVLLIGGSKGKVGAMVLASTAALRTGSGLVHGFIDESERIILQTAAPEVMVAFKEELENLAKFDAIGIGPGWGLNVDLKFYESLLKNYKKPIVIDADGINLLASHPDLIQNIPQGSILTPHIKEFERLTGNVSNHVERLQKAKDFAVEYGLFLVLKGAYTSISCPDGKQFFNSSGNQYMATAGSGDVLTGMITSFLGQGYTPLNATICGVFHHGLAGELASFENKRGTIASDIIKCIPKTYLELGID